LRAIAAKIDAPLAENELRAVVFNPSLQPLDQVVELTFDIPAEWPSFAEFFGNPGETTVQGRLLIPAGSPLASCRMVEWVGFESRSFGDAEPMLGAEHSFSLRPKEIAALDLRWRQPWFGLLVRAYAGI
jgi:hypothetical protein